MPNGCAFSEALRFPWSNQAIDLPRPHPGQKLKPRFLNRQKLICGVPVDGSYNAKAVIPDIQMKASQGK